MGLKMQSFDDEAEFEQSIQKGKGGSSGLIWSIPKDGCTVQFLAEPVEWLKYFEYWTGSGMVALQEDEIVPDDVRVSERYIAPVVMTDRDQAVLMKLPKTLANDLFVLKQKYDDTLLDRYFDLGKSGSGMETKYHVAADRSPTKFDRSSYDIDWGEDAVEEALMEDRERIEGDSGKSAKAKAIESDDDPF